MNFRPGQPVFLNFDAIPPVEKEFSIDHLASDLFRVEEVIVITPVCTCGCDERASLEHLPLCNLEQIKKIGCDQLLTILSGDGRIRTYPALWFH